MNKRTAAAGILAGAAAVVLTVGVAAAVSVGSDSPDREVDRITLSGGSGTDAAATPSPTAGTGAELTAAEAGGDSRSDVVAQGPSGETTPSVGRDAVPAGIDATRAAELAVAARPGTVLEVELSDEAGRVVWDVDVRSSDGRLWDVYVDAADGSIVEIDLEGPRDAGYDDDYSDDDWDDE